MFYRPGTDDHGLAHNPFKAMVSPRPIAWISTRDGDGHDNLAPYSFFNAFADSPPVVAYGSTGTKPDGQAKDSMDAIAETKVFAVNLMATDMVDAMNRTTAHLPRGTDEFEAAGLDKAACEVIDAPRVAAAPASFECRLIQIIDLPGRANRMALGEVVGIHMNPAFVRDGRFDVTLYKPLARLGYRDYASIEQVFELARPDD